MAVHHRRRFDRVPGGVVAVIRVLLGMVTAWAMIRGWQALGERTAARRLRAELVEVLGYDPLKGRR